MESRPVGAAGYHHRPRAGRPSRRPGRPCTGRGRTLAGPRLSWPAHNAANTSSGPAQRLATAAVPVMFQVAAAPMPSAARRRPVCRSTWSGARRGTPDGRAACRRRDRHGSRSSPRAAPWPRRIPAGPPRKPRPFQAISARSRPLDPYGHRRDRPRSVRPPDGHGSRPGTRWPRRGGAVTCAALPEGACPWASFPSGQRARRHPGGIGGGGHLARTVQKRYGPPGPGRGRRPFRLRPAARAQAAGVGCAAVLPSPALRKSRRTPRSGRGRAGRGHPPGHPVVRVPAG
ncbi:hypothetical protein SDIAM103S_05756 [Streptomyces diastaticus subsp. diastaticus]